MINQGVSASNLWRLLRAKKRIMQLGHLRQNTVLKGFFRVLLVIACLFFTVSAQAQGIDATQIAQMAKSGQISQAATALAGKTKIPFNDSIKFVQKLQSDKFDLTSASKLVDGLTNGNIEIGKIDDVTKMLDQLEKGQASIKAVSDLLKEVGNGAISPEIGKALGSIKDLGKLTDIKSISDVFKNPEIAKSLSDLSKNLKLPDEAQKILDSISSVSKIISDPAALLKNPEALTKAITDTLKKIAPELAKKLETLLGSDLAQALLALLGGGLLGGGGDSESNSGASCGAECSTCQDCAPKINQNHQTIRAHVTSEFEQHRQWIVTTYFLEHIVPSIMLMASEFTTNMMQQVQVIGTFFDAKHQLETERLFQQMTAKAHKDYHPSEGLCTIGTNVRSLAASERKANLGQVAFANRMQARQLSNKDTLSTFGSETDRNSRLDLFIKKFCNKDDYAKALGKLCADGGANKSQFNMDIDYTSAFENKLTLAIDYTNESPDQASDDEENIFALSANLFGNDIPRVIVEDNLVDDNGDPTAYADWYLDLRAIAAKRSVAQNSFAAITALKSEGDDEVAPFLKAILIESGVAPADIEKRLGEKPSYFAQMEVLTKDLYQNPTFYANLYDKPVNIERKAAALQAIELMQDRDIYRSLIRSEAVLATLVETLLRKEHAAVTRNLDNVSYFGEAPDDGTRGGE